MAEGNHTRERTEYRLKGQMLGRPLTPRENAVMELLAQGLNNKEIALHFGSGWRTVQHHAWNVRQKYGAKSMLQAMARWARENRPRYF